MLPNDLRQAESQAMAALQSALQAKPNGRWTVELRFEGLRLLPLALRLAATLAEQGMPLRVLCADAGATALARRDQPTLAATIASLADHQRLHQPAAGPDGLPSAPEDAGPAPEEPPQSEGTAEPLLLLVGPSPSDYPLVEAICTAHRGAVVLLNPTLEDAAVGIGSVARARRKGFLAVWQAAYALQPFPNSALRRAHPGEWELYRLDADGFRLAAQFPEKPSSEEQAAALTGEDPGSLKQQLRGLGDLLDNLQR